ncbi:helix-hairpin-helix domain-containing protein [Bacillus inaquosorum]|nr:helix-hairpin-helix domain-containing protein [Bacillus inaquosorum]MCY8374674.1 helix-hairpin-helix domain-containing protein [Bacillus inaquosorum]MEC0559352.1 helix-hairpin-helix domain-containing protein [Bacillus inaquosorum]
MEGALVNINTATLDELQGISGVGPSKAEAIIAYREENGRFQTIEDITKVSGIGEKSFEKIKSSITVK